jgi:hypothetical protein
MADSQKGPSFRVGGQHRDGEVGWNSRLKNITSIENRSTDLASARDPANVAKYGAASRQLQRLEPGGWRNDKEISPSTISPIHHQQVDLFGVKGAAAGREFPESTQEEEGPGFPSFRVSKQRIQAGERIQSTAAYDPQRNDMSSPALKVSRPLFAGSSSVAGSMRPNGNNHMAPTSTMRASPPDADYALPPESKLNSHDRHMSTRESNYSRMPPVSSRETLSSANLRKPEHTEQDGPDGPTFRVQRPIAPSSQNQSAGFVSQRKLDLFSATKHLDMSSNATYLGESTPLISTEKQLHAKGSGLDSLPTTSPPVLMTDRKGNPLETQLEMFSTTFMSDVENSRFVCVVCLCVATPCNRSHIHTLSH